MTKQRHKRYLISVLLLFIFCVPGVTHAQLENVVFEPLLEGITLVGGGAENYLQRIYIIMIGAAGLIATAKIVWAGIKYVTSGVVTEKSGAKKDIQNAIIGLLIILLAVVLLRTINPSLANLPAIEPLGSGIPGYTSISDTLVVNPGDSIEIDSPDRSRFILGCTSRVRIIDTPRGDRLLCSDSFDNTTEEVRAWCSGGGGCDEVIACENLDEYFWEIMAAGGVAGVAGGVAVGIVSGPVTLAVAAIGGGVASYYAASEANTLTCDVGCSFLGGMFDGDSCYIANDLRSANIDAARRHAEEQDTIRAEEKADIAANTPRTQSETTDYFDLPITALTGDNFGQPVNSIGDINAADRTMLMMRYNIMNNADTDRIYGKFTIAKNVPNTPEGIDEYTVMLANIETNIRGKCTSGTVEKIILSESSTASMNTTLHQTVYYCIRP